MGFEHFHLYDNGSSDSTAEVLRDYIVQGRATLLTWPEVNGQTSAYNHALKVFGRDSEWMALIDPDEFIQVDAGHTLRGILTGLEGADQVLLPWMHFDSAGHDEPPGELVIEAYTRRAETALRQPKSLVRPEAVVWAEVHHCITRHSRTVDPAGAPLPERWLLDRPPAGSIRLNHYFTKSRAEFAEKIARGQVDGGRGKTMEAFTRHHCPVQDASLALLAPAVREALRETASRPKRPLVHAAWSAQSELSPSRAWTLRVQAVLKELRTLLPPEAVIGTGGGIEWQQLALSSGYHPVVAQAFDRLRHDLGAHLVQPTLEAGRWQAPENVRLGRPYLALAGRCAGPSQAQVTARGHDAGGKPFTVQVSLDLPAGDSLTLAILSERTMTVDQLLLAASTPVVVLDAEIGCFS